MKKLYMISTLILLFTSSLSFGQVGSLDPEFGSGDGLVTTSFFPDLRCQGYGIDVQEDGKIVVSGYTRALDGLDYAVLLRYNTDGTLDNSFNGTGRIILPNGNINSFSRQVRVQSDGKIVMTALVEDSLIATAIIYRFLADGSPDTSFDSDGVATSTLGTYYLSASALALQPDGKILIGGYAAQTNDTFDLYYVARFLPNGTPDATFDGDGIATIQVGENYNSLASVLVQSDGKIIAVGYGVVDQNDAFAVVRFTGNGMVDHTFSGDGIAYATFGPGDDGATGAVIQPDGKIVVGGYAFNSATGATEFAVARFNPNGTLDNNFHGDGMNSVMVSGHADGVRCIALQPDGKILLGGYAHSNITGGADMALVRLNDNGIPDFTFDGDGAKIYEDDLTTSSEIFRMVLQPDGKIVGTGFERVSGLNSIRVTRIISGITVSTADENLNALHVTLFPNPLSEQCILEYELDQHETISINLYDMQGKLIQTLLSPCERNPGQHTEALHFYRPLTPGSYFVSIETKDGRKAVKVVAE